MVIAIFKFVWQTDGDINKNLVPIPKVLKCFLCMVELKSLIVHIRGRTKFLRPLGPITVLS